MKKKILIFCLFVCALVPVFSQDFYKSKKQTFYGIVISGGNEPFTYLLLKKDNENYRIIANEKQLLKLAENKNKKLKFTGYFIYNKQTSNVEGFKVKKWKKV